jgi:hypothetical protein
MHVGSGMRMHWLVAALLVGKDAVSANRLAQETGKRG